ncbi:hypothetical protein [Acholeplasma laidlawii]|uniref:hypothetical protein n=1 Tax=Acholeplasma laidlawii TaxID=2148 RepID=UPI00253FF29B|nr:hypothetical protein QOL21_01605 [Acholeplasma laidlawii]
MKKITTLLLLFVTALILVGAQSYAEEDTLIDVYPYGDANNMTETLPIAGGTVRTGTSHWAAEILGYRYHFIRNSVRYAHMFTDSNANGTFQPGEYSVLSYNAFSVLTLNNTDAQVTLTTTGNRADITDTFHGMYAYFDADGKLQKFEDMILQYYIHNDGSDNTNNANWRFATESEIAAFDAAENKAEDTPKTRFTQIRVIRDSVSPKGYLLEPLASTKWTNPDMVALGDDVTKHSILMDVNPSNVVIPAGWTVMSFGTRDRDGSNVPALNLVKAFAPTFKETEIPVLNLVYSTPDPLIEGLAANDDDSVTAGTQMIVEYNQTDFNLPNNVKTSWVRMYDESGKIINKKEYIDYEVQIYDSADFNSAEEDHVPTILETIKFTYDSDTNSYTADADVTKIDSSVFGAGYTAVYTAKHPLDGVVETTVDIAVGVLPPRFENVKNRYVDEGVFVDLLDQITASDGYGNDKTNDIRFTFPAGFNMYNPKPGTYKIDLEFTHNVFIAGLDYSLSIKGTEVPWDHELALDAVGTNGVGQAINGYVLYQVFTKNELIRTAAASWGSMIVIVGADGLVKESYSRYDHLYVTAENPNGVVKDETFFNTWKAAIDLQEGEYAVTGHGSTQNVGPTLRALRYGDSVQVVIGTPDFDTDIITKASYTLKVDDITAPQLLVVDNDYTIEADKYSSVQAAIFANIVAIDNHDSRSDLTLYVDDNGNMALVNGKLAVGTYTVSVGAEDKAGNATTVSFKVVVKEAKPTQEEVDQKTEEVESQIPQDTITPDQVQDAIENALDSYDGVSVLTAVLMSLGAALVSFGGAALLFFLKKK